MHNRKNTSSNGLPAARTLGMLELVLEMLLAMLADCPEQWRELCAPDGVADGLTVGCTLGTPLGLAEGITDGLTVGAEGLAVSYTLGTALGLTVGSTLGTALGLTVGCTLGTALRAERVTMRTGRRSPSDAGALSCCWRHPQPVANIAQNESKLIST